MRKKDKPSELERFLGEREGIKPITSARLEADLLKVIEDLRTLAGRDRGLNGALRYLLLQPLRQVAEDLEAIRRMGEREAGQRSVPYNLLGLLGRWLITPNIRQGKKGLPSRIADWYPKDRPDPEVLYRLPRPWGGRDFIIWNDAFEEPHFRAWSAKLYEPSRRQIEVAPPEVLAALAGVHLPKRQMNTAALRLSLATGQSRVVHGWLRIEKGSKFSWVKTSHYESKRPAGIHLPQTYVAACVPLLGPTFGLSVEEIGQSDEGKWMNVTWSGAFVLRECIRCEDWVPVTQQ